MEPRGAYPADRAAALSGVPLSTVHYWARHGILVPSLSAEKVKLWSYADLLSLRTISWLRHEKDDPGGTKIPAASMPAVRLALGRLHDQELDLFSDDGAARVFVDRTGEIFLRPNGRVQDLEGRLVIDGVLDLIAPFPTDPGVQGPDLREPRPHLRIVPGKLSGEPHVKDTRLETQAVAALRRRGVSIENIVVLYPFVEPVAIEEAIDLEDQLARNVPLRDAA